MSLEKGMNKHIKLSPLAKRDLAIILEYLDLNWNAKVINNFIDVFQECLKRISYGPNLFSYFRKDLNIRKCIVTKHNTLYFRENTNEIQILRVYDVRQNPNKLKF